MTESPLVNRWIHSGVVAMRRTDLLAVLDSRFPGAVEDDVRATIQQNDSLELLGEWLVTAARAGSADEFRAALRR